MAAVPSDTTTTATGASPSQRLSPSGSKVVQRADPPPFEIKSAARRDRWLKFGVYATHGAGKTYLMGSAVEVPNMRDVLMLNAEKGDLTLYDADFSVKVEDHLDIVDASSMTQINWIYRFLKDHCTLRDRVYDARRLKKVNAASDEDVSEATSKLADLEARVYLDRANDLKDRTCQPREYRTLIIDSVTEAEAYCMNQLLNVTDQTSMADPGQAAEWTEFKQNHGMILRMMRSFRDLPMHVLFSFQRGYTQDEMNKRLFMPLMTGKLASRVQGYLDMVGYLITANPTEAKPDIVPRRLYVQPSPTGKFDAKNRFAKFKGSFFDDPTMHKILEAIDYGIELPS